jgi:L-threonylcarbamoyladenylate synthase
MPLSFSIHKAGRIIRNGGVVTCPTEGVFGLSCLPDDIHAIERILTIKQRNPAQGLILIAGNAAQLCHWIDTDREIPFDPLNPITWVTPASTAVPPWISGRHASIAVRISPHPIAAALCTAAGSALVSTSANVSGRAAISNPYVLRRQFQDLVDYIVPGRCGSASGSSEIRDLISDKVLRPSGL